MQASDIISLLHVCVDLSIKDFLQKLAVQVTLPEILKLIFEYCITFRPEH